MTAGKNLPGRGSSRHSSPGTEGGLVCLRTSKMLVGRCGEELGGWDMPSSKQCRALALTWRGGDLSREGRGLTLILSIYLFI